jgi:hypothetical protein
METSGWADLFRRTVAVHGGDFVMSGSRPSIAMEQDPRFSVAYRLQPSLQMLPRSTMIAPKTPIGSSSPGSIATGYRLTPGWTAVARRQYGCRQLCGSDEGIVNLADPGRPFSGPLGLSGQHNRRAKEFPYPSCGATGTTSIPRPLKLTMPTHRQPVRIP